MNIKHIFFIFNNILCILIKFNEIKKLLIHFIYLYIYYYFFLIKKDES